GAFAVLQVEQLGAGDADDVEGREDVAVDTGSEDPGDHLVDRVAVPPAVHVGLADADRALLEDAAVEPLVVDPHVPRPVATGHDVGRLEQRPEAILHLLHAPWNLAPRRAALHQVVAGGEAFGTVVAGHRELAGDPQAGPLDGCELLV